MTIRHGLWSLTEIRAALGEPAPPTPTAPLTARHRAPRRIPWWQRILYRTDRA